MNPEFIQSPVKSINPPSNLVEFLQCEAPKIAKLVQITPISLWFMVRTYNELVTGANLVTNVHITTGGTTLYIYHLNLFDESLSISFCHR